MGTWWSKLTQILPSHSDEDVHSKQKKSDSLQKWLLRASSSLPEGKDHEAGDDENHCKHSEDQVTRFPPAGVVEHLGRLQREQRAGAAVHVKTADQPDGFMISPLEGRAE